MVCECASLLRMSISLSQDLLRLGFSANDAAVYLALLKQGPCMAGPLITETKFHRNIVYTSLEHLQARKLVSEKTIKGRKQFMVTDPERLAAEFSEKAVMAKTVSHELRTRLTIIPQEITIHQGNEEYETVLTSIIRSLPKGATKYVLGTGGEAFMQETMIPIWEAYHRVVHAQHLKIRMIGYEPQRRAIDPWTAKEEIYETRYLPPQLENPSGIHIYPEVDTVLNIIYSNEQTPVTAIKIQNAALTKGYLHLFQNLWKIARV
jgi:predicted transcriptional regulator